MKTGMVAERSCTDIPCLIVWVLFLFSLSAITAFGYLNGNMDKLLAPVDGDSNLCGIGETYGPYKYLYLTHLDASGFHSEVFKSGVCVKECPTTATSTFECYGNVNVP